MKQKITKEEQLKALEQLRESLTPDAKIYASVVSVARSGLSRKIKIFVHYPEGLHNITHLIHRAGMFGYCRRDNALKVNGCGMDMIYHVLETVAMSLCNGDYKLYQSLYKDHRYTMI